MLKKSKSGVWQIDLTVEPYPRVRQSTKTKDRALAEKIHKKIEADLLMGKHGMGKAKMTFDQAFKKAWQLEWQGTKNAFKVDQIWKQLTDKKRGFIDPNSDVTRFKSEQVLNLKGALVETGNSKATINRKLAVVRRILNLCVEWGVLEAAPKVKAMEETDSLDRHYEYTQDEEREMVAFFSERYPQELGLFEFLLSSGNRLGEVLKLDKGDYSLESGKVRFIDTKSGDTLVKPMTGIMRRVLTDRQHQPKPFPYTTDQAEHYWEKFREYMGRLDDPRFIIHNLRHTCASRLVADGIDLKRLQEWMGHKSYTTTLRYAQLKKEHLQDVAEAQDKREKQFDHSLTYKKLKEPQAESVVIAVDFTKQRLKLRPGGEIGRHKGLKIPRLETVVPVRPRPRAPFHIDSINDGWVRHPRRACEPSRRPANRKFPAG